ncbi:MAG: stage III sporulation protein AD [Clostridiales bacterium]|jgi:stage III sporulation protein AD|nr:stage III sporulation protein AD [Clostridiales bacterium]HOB64612.1 SpoIIIAC/SpoIIIAD family protein [Clostridia bacterium]HOK81519.1 SpoIIIAC/SpoIIIAD family protein [Clostridia bacterium]HOL60965.1 SpoIIIAC/SpoIIIAD family protein [Clostridia bacterium]HPO53443.1 SpoIIIAC/SpoIIIAD family protein [Clostridia bacterium]
MDIVKVILVALLGVMVVVILKDIKPELAFLAAVVTGAAILLMILSEITGIFDSFKGLSEGAGGEGKSIFVTILKIVGIGYLTEYSAGICDDYGSHSIGKKVQLAGKVSIFAMAIPIFANIIATIGAIVK